MKTIKTIAFVLFLCPLMLLAQRVPEWMNDELREHNYPKSEYFSGIGYGNLSGKTRTQAISEAENNARTEALSTILVNVKSTTKSSVMSREFSKANEMDEQYVEIFSSNTRVDVAFKDVPGLHVENYTRGSEVTAFAYVRKSELIRYYDRKITVSLTQLESALDNAEQLAARGEKIRAREIAKSVVVYAADVENAQRILLAIDRNADVQPEKSSVLSKRLVRTFSELKNSTAIYLDCKAYNEENQSYRLFSNDLKGQLSKLGCNFVNSREKADWVISIEAEVDRKNNPNSIAYFVWIDGAIAVRNNATSQVIYNEHISAIKTIKGESAVGFKQATSDAYKKAARIVGEKISEIINN